MGALIHFLYKSAIINFFCSFALWVNIVPLNYSYTISQMTNNLPLTLISKKLTVKAFHIKFEPPLNLGDLMVTLNSSHRGLVLEH